MAQPGPEVFLDSSSGEPMVPDARRALTTALESGWGDPARVHRPGRLAAQALDEARAVVAAAVGARPDEVVFTGSGVQANLAAVAGVVRGRRRVGRRVVTSAVDHSSVLSAAAEYGEHEPVGVDREGRVDLARWAAAVAEPGTAAACLQVANHEVGTRQPYAEAAEACARTGVPLLLDATAALGRVDLTDSPGWSVLTGWAGASADRWGSGCWSSGEVLAGGPRTRWTTTRRVVGPGPPTPRRSTPPRWRWTTGGSTVGRSLTASTPWWPASGTGSP